MPYSSFRTLEQVEELGLCVVKTKLFPKPPTANSPLSEILTQNLERGKNLVLSSSSEKAKSEFIIAPLIAELWAEHHCGIFSGASLNVDTSKQLNGELDFAISKEDSVELKDPILVIVESKKGELKDGLYQLCAEMYAAMILGNDGHDIYGILTTGMLWQFLKLAKGDRSVYLDTVTYGMNEIDVVYHRLVDIITA